MNIIPNAPDNAHRADLVRGLREVADLLERQPDVPAPWSVRPQVNYPGDETEQRAAIRRDADALGLTGLTEYRVNDGSGDLAVIGELPITDAVTLVLYAQFPGAAPTPAQVAEAVLSA